MGFRLSGQVLETVTGLTPAQKLILLGIAERADRLGENAFPSVATLATYAECSDRNVEIGLQKLREAGWVLVQRKATNRLPTTYKLNIEKLDSVRRGEETSPPSIGVRGEDSSPQGLLLNEFPNESARGIARGEDFSPHGISRGEDLCTLGAKFSTFGGEETSPDPVSTEPILEPIQESAAQAPPLPSPKSLVATWNAHRKPGPKILDITPQRAAAYTRALVANPELADWRVAVDWLNRQAYANAPGTGKNPTWRAGLDWLAKPGNLARILEHATTDAEAPPNRPRRLGDPPTAALTMDQADDLRARAKRREAARVVEDQLVDEASRLVLQLTEGARMTLERDALVELEHYRDRSTPSQFDEWVCQALPLKLIARAAGRPLADVVAELEKGVAA